jgi:Metallo-beta-lactamase superfamily
VRVIQVRRTGKGCLSYLIGADEEAAVIDASLDPQVYLDLAAEHGWQVTRVLETHIHADHLSRSRQLAEQSGARLMLPDQQRVTFPFTAVYDGERLPSETMQLVALQTPGHTLLALPAETLVLAGHTSAPTPFDGVPIMATLREIDEQVDILHATRSDFGRILLSRLPATPPNYAQIVRLNEQGLLPEQPVTELEAGANRCAIS